MLLSPTTDASSPAARRTRILALKEQLNAVILAHYYQEAEIQDLADFVGDSLELARRAAETSADVIVFCGVHFMAETAKILNPGKVVLLPDIEAGCSLADAAPTHAFRRFRELHPDHLAVTYINCTAEVKALSDIICTSSSAERIIRAIPAHVPILFAPDKNLGRYLMRTTGRDMLLWQGACIVHEQFSASRIISLMFEHPDAMVLAHPECEEAVLDHADFIGSTSALLGRVRELGRGTFIVATEAGILHQMRQACPDAVLIPAPPEGSCSCSECPYMRLNTLEKLVRCMERGEPRIELDEAVRQRALLPIERMLELSRPEGANMETLLEQMTLPFDSKMLHLAF